jgi:branched-chain amino acid transport system ATP-binding protein
MKPLLETKGLTALYGDFQALFGIDVTVGQGECVALIGSNGAGKSTF